MTRIDTNSARAPVRLWPVLIGIGCLATALHAANLLYLASALDCALVDLACPGPITPWLRPDSHTYLSLANQILEEGFLGASYLHRWPGYPLALAAAKTWFGAPFLGLWWAPLVAGAAAVAMGWTAWTFTERVSAAAAAALLFCAWPNTYRYTPMLLTDAVHAYLVVCAFAVTLAWRRSERWTTALGAAALWAAAQSVRPTFTLLPVLLPILLWRRHRPPFVTVTSVAIWLVSWLVPIFCIVSSLERHGASMASARIPKMLSHYTVPLIKERMGLGSFNDLRTAAKQRYGRMPLLKRVEVERRESLQFLAEHPGAAFGSVAAELRRQLTSPLRPYEYDELWPLYPDWSSSPQAFLVLFWLSAALGLLLMARSHPAVVLFLVATFALVMIPAATSHGVQGRLRLPVDLLSIPLAVVCWQRIAGVVRDGFAGAGSGR